MLTENLDSLVTKATEARAVRVARSAPEWIVPAVKVALALIDTGIAVVAFFAAFYLREGDPIFARSLDAGFTWSAEFAPYGAVLLFAVPIRLLALLYYRLYRLRGEFSYIDETVRIFKATATGSLLIVAVAFLYRGGFLYRDFSYSRGIFVLDFLMALVAYTSLRLVVRSTQARVRRQNLNLIPTLVVGRGAEAALYIREMRERPELGYRVIGVVENSLIDETVESFEGVPVIGNINNLPQAILESKANEVIIADPNLSNDLLFDVMMRVGRRHRIVEFRLVPNLFNCLPRKTEIDQIGALPMISIFREPLSSAARVVKRASDIVVASLALLLLAPVCAVIALLIKLDSRGPVLYRQERVGMDGRLFLCFKFRTMRAGASDDEHREVQRKHIRGTLETMANNAERPVHGKVPDDARITRVGHRLRRLSLDELPQLLNVLAGDMSVVGPRPPIPYEVEAYELWHRKRLDMKPGLTGLWQVSGRNRLSFEEMVRLDLFYIENWSLLLDLRIILRTLPVLLRGDTH